MDQPSSSGSGGPRLELKGPQMQIRSVVVSTQSRRWTDYGGQRIVPCFTNRNVSDPERCPDLLKGKLVLGDPFVLMTFVAAKEGQQAGKTDAVSRSPIDVVCYGVVVEGHTATCTWLPVYGISILSLLAALAMRQVPQGGGFLDLSNEEGLPDVLLDPYYPISFPVCGTGAIVFSAPSGTLESAAFEPPPGPVAKGPKLNAKPAPREAGASSRSAGRRKPPLAKLPEVD